MFSSSSSPCLSSGTAPVSYTHLHKVLTPKDYINFKLTGMACIDPTEASGSLLLDVATGQWSDLLIRKIGIDREKLPAIVPATAVVGEVSRQEMCIRDRAYTAFGQGIAVLWYHARYHCDAQR